MKRLLVIFIFIINWFLQASLKVPDYSRTCAYVQENLDARSKIALPKLLGSRSLAYIATHMDKAAIDSIDHYTKPINELQLGAPYKYRQLDSALRPLNLEILNGINRFQRQLNDTTLAQNQRVFALQVLIGLHTAMALPLQGVSHLLPRDEFIKHDIFMFIERPHYKTTALITFRLYEAYKLGVRMAQADGDKQMIASLMDQGYEVAGRCVAGSIKDAFRPKWTFETEGPNFGRIMEPGKDPIYVYSAVPRFPGGLPYFNKFMNEHLHYPVQEWDKGIEGTCYAEIVVEKDGSISRITVSSGISPRIDSEVLRVLRLSPKWEPGRLDDTGPVVRSQWTCIVTFRIKPGQKRQDAFNIPFHDNLKPQFPGGKTEFEKYIRANITYTGPPYGQVTLHYMVDTSGKISDVKLYKKLSPEADAEAIRLLKQSPKWQPGAIQDTYKATMGDTISVWFQPKK